MKLYSWCKKCLSDRDKAKFINNYICRFVGIKGEIWKDIAGYEGYYEISNLGRVRNSLKRVITKKLNGNGYFRLILYKNKVQKNKTIHRLLAEAFIPNPENKPQVNHINGIKTDFRLQNLEWVTGKENSIHAHVNGFTKNTYEKGLNHVGRKVTKDLFDDIKEQLFKKIRGTEIARQTGLSVTTISKIKHNRYKNIAWE